jgi:hypothetical protein
MKTKNKPSRLLAYRLLLACWLCCGVAAALTSCKHTDEEPALNKGYATDYRMPDAESMTAEDSALVATQQAEYDQNAK